MSLESVLSFVINFTALGLAVIIHEIAHGWAALRCGDTTARDAHRLTLNPLRHIDLLGSIILPLILFFSNAGVLFGWAKPVPINPSRCRNPRQAFWIVSLAGPLSNLLQALLATLPLVIANVFDIRFSFDIVPQFLFQYSVINLLLMMVNLIPIPPLDGSKIVAAILPLKIALPYLRLERIGFIVLFFLFKYDCFDSFFKVFLVHFFQLMGLVN